jgi:hypothetical protein
MVWERIPPPDDLIHPACGSVSRYRKIPPDHPPCPKCSPGAVTARAYASLPSARRMPDGDRVSRIDRFAASDDLFPHPTGHPPNDANGPPEALIGRGSGLYGRRWKWYEDG